ncbi:MAG: transposase family protein [Candidatus Gastranaerophilales bacterium]|nr:transposase family protein [Candidatus Gastranaerophilales bacterium]
MTAKVKQVLNSYIKIKELANFSNISLRSLQRYCSANKYQYRIVNGNGGKQYEILVSSLEPELQQKIISQSSNTQLNTTACVFSGATTTTLAPVPIQNNFAVANIDSNVIKNTLATFGLDKVRNNNFAIPYEARKKALFKVDVLKKWEEHREVYGKKNKLKADKDFEELFNSGLISKKLLKEVGQISIKSIYRWAKEYKESNNNYVALVNGYNYGSETHLITYLSDIEKFMLLKFMLHQNKYSLGKAYELIKIELQKLGYRDLSGISAYRRLWNYLCKNYSDMITFAREGKKAALDKTLPCILRERPKNVGDALVGDGHVLDFMVKNPLTGKPVRATIVGFLDWRSWEFCGYEIMVSENTQSIASALRNSIIHLGKMPKVVYIDNGKAFKNKAFNGIKADFAEEGIAGIYEKLGIKVQYSKPYNGREKVIERFWKELTSSLAKLMPSYIGNNIENQPAATKRNEQYHKNLQGDYVPTIEETKAIIETWLNNVYRQRIDKDTKLTIAEFFSQNKGKGVNTDLLDDLLMASTERKIGRNGIRLFNELYYSPALTGLNMSVIAKYNMFDLSYIKVYSADGEYICRAEKQISVNPLAMHLGTAKDLQELRTKQKQMKKIEKNRLAPIKTTLSELYGSYKKRKADVKPQANYIINQSEEYQITCYENMNINIG